MPLLFQYNCCVPLDRVKDICQLKTRPRRERRCREKRVLRLQQASLQRFQDEIGPVATQVLELDALPSKEDFVEIYVKKSQPFIVRGASKHWKAHDEWDLDYLESKIGPESLVNISRVPGHGEVDGAVLGYFTYPRVDHVPFGEFSDSLRQSRNNTPRVSTRSMADPTSTLCDASVGESLVARDSASHEESKSVKGTQDVTYMSEANDNLRNRFPQLLDDIEPYPCTFGLEPEAVNLWIGGPDCKAPIHSDTYQNLFTVIAGVKHFRIYHPLDAAYMYSSRLRVADYIKDGDDWFFQPRNPMWEQAWVTVSSSDPDLDRHPMHKHARPIEVTVRPGDVFFMPLFWYHRVTQTVDEKEGKAIAVNYWYPDTLMPPAQLLFLEFHRKEVVKLLGDEFTYPRIDTDVIPTRPAQEVQPPLPTPPSSPRLTANTLAGREGDEGRVEGRRGSDEDTIGSLETDIYGWIWAAAQPHDSDADTSDESQ